MEIKNKYEEQEHDTENETLPDENLNEVNGGYDGNIHYEPIKERPAWMNSK